MDVPPEIAFRNVEANDHLKEEIQEGISRLEEVYPRLVSCRVLVEDTTPDRHAGKIHRVRLEIRVPHRTLVVDRDPPAAGEKRDLGQTLREAFDIGRRRLLEIKDRQRGDVKTHALPPHGRVVRLLTDGAGVRYGFLMARDGREVYFHENALVGIDFEDLDVGTEVRFAEARGDQGPQASTVAPLDPALLGPRHDGSVPLRSPEPE